MKPVLFILSGILIGICLFLLGAMDDAPGLCLIGLTLAFLLMMRGIYHAGIIRRGYHIPIVLLAFGFVGLLLPIVLLLDGEITGRSPILILGAPAGIAMLAFAVIRLKHGCR